MNIVQIISSEGFYGAESMLLSLATALSRLGCNIRVAVFRDLRNPHTELGIAAARQGLMVKHVDCKGRWDWNAVRRIRRIGEQHETDLFHAHGYKADLYTYAAVRSKGAALISTCHNWPSRKPLMQAYAKVDRFVLRRFHRVTTPSPNVVAILRNSGIPGERITYIPNGVDVNHFRGASPRLRRELHAEGVPLVGFVGRHLEGKGGAVLLRAAQQVLARGRDARFVFVGEGPAREEWTRLASGLGIGEKVFFVGKRDDMPGVYASLNILALPSFDEAMPMCVLEAMAAGVPVIASAVGAVPDVVIANSTGCLVEAGNITDLAEELKRLLDNPNLSAQFGREAVRRVDGLFSADAMARRYLDLYKEAMRGKTALADVA